jgi:hypothetical protein
MRTLRGAVLLLLGCLSGAACGGAEARPAPPPAPEPVAAPAPSAAPAETKPPPDPDHDAILAARPSLKACYDKARKTNPSLGRTTVTVSVRVDEAGKVTTVDLDYVNKIDDTSKSCMRDAAFAIKLPPGSPRRVTAPVALDAS